MPSGGCSFSALQRAEIAEIDKDPRYRSFPVLRFSALQRAEIAEMYANRGELWMPVSFSALQRAEIAEIYYRFRRVL